MLKTYTTIIVVFFFTLVLCSCGNDPGPLKGEWKKRGAITVSKVSFRSGEIEQLGMINKVSYKVEGNSVVVTYKGGLFDGSTDRIKMIDPDTARWGKYKLYRINK